MVKEPAKNSEPSLVYSLFLIILGGFSIFVFTLLVLSGGYFLRFNNQIFPGVSIAGVPVSGINKEEAALKISQNLLFSYTGKILFRDGNRSWLATPAELGMIINPGESVSKAYDVGRNGSLIQIIKSQLHIINEGIDLPVIIIFDQKVAYAYLQRIATEIDQPVIEAKLSLEGINVISSNGKVGRLLNVDATMELLINQMQMLSDGEVPLIFEIIEPIVLDVNLQDEILRKLTSNPSVLTLPEAIGSAAGPWIIEPYEMAGMIQIDMIITNQKGEFNIGLNEEKLTEKLYKISESIQQEPENARFIFNDETRQLDLITQSKVGLNLNIEESKNEIIRRVKEGLQEIKLVADLKSPAVGDDASSDSLGISELVSTGVTYFRGSSEERIQNIQTAAGRFHGLLVAPGDTFSMGDALGDVSLENGYAEAMIIYDNRTIKGVGGGVCQVSTTLFRTVFLGGYPVIERHPHAYRVGYYEQTYGGHDANLAGLDATVFIPLVDFKFTNDTPYWLLMETYVNVSERRLTWKFYSTKDGRVVEWNTSGPQDVIPAPEPILQENPELGTYEMKQVDWSADGAVIRVNRTVIKGGQVYFEDLFSTVYSPWQAICEYGSGVEDPQAKAAAMGLCQP